MKKYVATLVVASAIAVSGCSQQSTHQSGAQDADQVLADEVSASGKSRAKPAKTDLVRKETRQQLKKEKKQESEERTRNDMVVSGTLPSAKFAAPATAKLYETNAIGVAVQSFDQAGIRRASEPLDRENYLPIAEAEVKLASEEPVSTFSVDVDTAAYSNIRRMLLQEGRLPPRDAVRIEELVNYFSYDYPDAEDLDAPFSVTTEVAPAPWNPGKHLMQIGLEGYEPDKEQRPDANLVFLVDVSGSMQDVNKLQLVKRSLKLLVNEMDQDDRIALVVYAGAAGVVLESTAGNHKRKILNAIDNLSAGGSTNGGAGIRLAYDIATENLIKGGINRVLIASDGDMNVGTASLEALKDLVETKRQTGVSLTTLGFGSGNYNSALMEQLADVGNGNAAYIDSIREAQKVLVDEMQSTLLTIAKDVKIQIEFNPQVVSEYRLIGYENRMLNREDFRNDNVDAGEIGAGHTVTALYEIVLAESQAAMVPALRYSKPSSSDQQDASAGGLDQELAYVRLRYKQPDADSSRELGQAVMKVAVKNSIRQSSQNLQFSAAVAGFGQLLRGGKFTERWDFDQAIQLAQAARGDDPHGYRSEFVSMVKLAKSYTPQNSRHKG